MPKMMDDHFMRMTLQMQIVVQLTQARGKEIKGLDWWTDKTQLTPPKKHSIHLKGVNRWAWSITFFIIQPERDNLVTPVKQRGKNSLLFR